MNIKKIEKTFLEKLSADHIDNLELNRESSGELVVKLECPCEEIGFIQAVIHDTEITLICKISHTHSEASYFRCLGLENPESQMVIEAAEKFSDFVKGRSCVSIETDHDGQIASYGWGPVEALHSENKAYIKMIEKMRGGPIKKRAWIWTGELDIGNLR